ncbi:hypothetical protein [Flavobacterium muglaense]|nr:hypothetical protein [Flavobacterium muglaense]
MEAIKADIIDVYESSGKKVSGEFLNGLNTSYSPNKATLSGYVYLAGRVAGKQPPTAPIEQWLIAKGITPIEKNMKISSLAYLIARKIGKQGTNKENHLKIYEQVITPERIDTILEKINKINVNLFINEITIMIQKIENK